VPDDPRGQDGYGVRFDWGPVGAARVGARNGALVIVDVLSFTTAVSVAVERGTALYPAPRRDAGAARMAHELGAALAVGRGECSQEHPWSLSPAALRSAPAAARLVLPSPNGSAIAAAANGVVVAACLRNARAVAAWLSERYRHADEPVSVIAAGERWPDGSLRPALEDLLGAGALLAALAQRSGFAESPEAATARAASTPSVPDAVRGCACGVELATPWVRPGRGGRSGDRREHRRAGAGRRALPAGLTLG
jgi:2-phosphosulfolactate phosphatase